MMLPEKPIEEEHGTKWTIDECYASYSRNYRGKGFCMITYELLKKSGDKERSKPIWSLLPPEGIRFFDLHLYRRTVWRCRRYLRIIFISSGCF